jgi:hypothetical protein
MRFGRLAVAALKQPDQTAQTANDDGAKPLRRRAVKPLSGPPADGLVEPLIVQPVIAEYVGAN